MTPETVRCFGLMIAAQTRVAGMVAENQQALACGNSVPYGEQAFLVEAFHLEQLAIQVINQ